jgi:hypothetical protein
MRATFKAEYLRQQAAEAAAIEAAKEHDKSDDDMPNLE